MSMTKRSRTANKHKVSGRKKRSGAVYGTTAENVSSIVVTYDHITGGMSFGGAMTNVYSEITYERPKGPKVLSRIPQKHRDIRFGSGGALVRNYQFVCAVD